ncbi:TolC family outer membrane protein [Alcaligenaceae bacterium]|nr:TolC family outer membrane protein [Alcaligenaceae bacterium]
MKSAQRFTSAFFLLFVACAMVPLKVHALTLSQAWRLALENDASYHAAISERKAGETNRAIGRSALLPQINASLGRSKVRGTLELPGPCGLHCNDLDYTSRVDEIKLNQVVFNWSRLAEYRQGHARADQSLAVFDVKATDMSVRLINRYFQTLLSYENVVLAKSRLKANEKQIIAAQRRYGDGEGTIIDVKESKSRRDLSRADLIAAEDRLFVAQRELQEMVGNPPQRITTLKRGFQPQPLNVPDQLDWQTKARTDNAEIRSAQYGVQISDYEIDRAFGGHLPTVDLIAARRKVEGETISTRLQSSTVSSYGVQVAIPIFSGGLTSAQVSQARHNKDRATLELAAVQEDIAVQVTRQYQAVVSGVRRIAALEDAVDSTAAALHAIDMGYQAGTRTIIDILDAEDQLYQSKLDLTQARLEYVLARLTLYAAADSLDAAAIDAIDQTYFGPEQVVLSGP